MATLEQAREHAKQASIEDNTRMSIWKDNTSDKHVVRDDRSIAPWGFTFVESHFIKPD